MVTHAFPRLLPLLALLALTGCGRNVSLPTAATPGTPGTSAASIAEPGSGGLAFPLSAHGFYPLEVGNRWHYLRTFEVSELLEDGGEPFVEVERSTREAVLESRLAFGPRDYVDERSVYEQDGVPTLVSHVYFRQDRTGLYEADFVRADAGTARVGPAPRQAALLERAWSRLASRLPDEAARSAFAAARERLARKLALVASVHELPAFPWPGEEPPPGELTRLRYPLQVGARWAVRRLPFRFDARVEGLEGLRLPAGPFDGWRIRYTSDLFGPSDLVLVWYGRDGFLQLDARLESLATDDQGHPIGTLVTRQTERLDEIALVGRGGR